MSQVPLPFPDDPPPGSSTAARRAPAAPAHELAGRSWAEAGGQVLDPPPDLAPFVDVGVLAPVDVHVATTLVRLGGDDRAEVLLAAALAVRAPRRRHVCVDLTTVRHGIVAELADDPAIDLVGDHDPVARLPWPDPAVWREVLTTSPLVAVRDPADLVEPDDVGADVRPLTLAGHGLYLDRYWRYERRVAGALVRRATTVSDPVAPDVLAAAIDRAFDGPAPDRQRVAAGVALTSGLTVVAGGPGTGKTTTVARLLRLLAVDARSAGRPVPHVALAAPTGKAAARLTEAIAEALVPDHTGDDADDVLLHGAAATTIHRLLGSRGSSSRFRHSRTDPLPHDVVVVDETSMVPLALLAKLLDAVRDDARVVLLGDPHQLASVEAGSVLADVVGDPKAAPARSGASRDRLTPLVGAAHLEGGEVTDRPGVADALVVLDRVHRFRAGSGIDRVATAVRAGDADAVLHELTTAGDLTWVDPVDAGDDATLRERLVTAGTEVVAAARAGDAPRALAALGEVRVLCAHRRGEAGVTGWVARVEAWLADAVGIDLRDRWYLGRPVLVTGNDHRLRLWNGDLGVVVRSGDDGVSVAFPDASEAATGGVRTLSPARVGSVETVHATTVHRSQGSQVAHAVVVLPDPASRICTRELLYTAVTRARTGVTVVGSEAAVRATVAAVTQRASGLGDALGRRPLAR